MAERIEGATVLVCVISIVVSFCLLHLLCIGDLIQLYTSSLSTFFTVGLRVTAHIKSPAVNCMCNEFNQNRDLWDAASFLGCTFIFVTTSHPFDFITAVSLTLSSHETPSWEMIPADVKLITALCLCTFWKHYCCVLNILLSVFEIEHQVIFNLTLLSVHI